MKESFWRNKRVLITGYEGFLGSHLTKTLLEHKAKIFALDIKTHRKETLLCTKDYARFKVIRGSVEDFSLLKRIINKNNIKFVFHLAAQALVSDCLKNPRRAFSTNIQGTWNILEACRQAKSIRALIIASSDKAYGISNRLPYKEDDSLVGCYPYDVSKSCADLLAKSYYASFKLPVCVTRCGNIFGPGDFHFSRIVPDTIRAAISDKTLLIRSDGSFTRDYIFVEDVVNGYISLAEKMIKNKISGQAFNFSNEKPISVLELVGAVYKACGKKPMFKILNIVRCEITRQYLSAAKARRLLGWKPRYSLKKGLRKTAQWYAQYL